MDYCRSKHLPMTIVSMVLRKFSIANCATLTKHYFAHIVLSDSADALKPNPAIFNYALDVNGASAEETLMIGDSLKLIFLERLTVGIDALF